MGDWANCVHNRHNGHDGHLVAAELLMPLLMPLLFFVVLDRELFGSARHSVISSSTGDVSVSDE